MKQIIVLFSIISVSVNFTFAMNPGQCEDGLEGAVGGDIGIKKNEGTEKILENYNELNNILRKCTARHTMSCAHNSFRMFLFAQKDGNVSERLKDFDSFASQEEIIPLQGSKIVEKYLDTNPEINYKFVATKKLIFKNLYGVVDNYPDKLEKVPYDNVLLKVNELKPGQSGVYMGRSHAVYFGKTVDNQLIAMDTTLGVQAAKLKRGLTKEEQQIRKLLLTDDPEMRAMHESFMDLVERSNGNPLVFGSIADAVYKYYFKSAEEDKEGIFLFSGE